MNDQPIELTLEQQFSLRSFNDKVDRMSHDQAKNFLKQLYHQMMLRENFYKHFMKQALNGEMGSFNNFGG